MDIDQSNIEGLPEEFHEIVEFGILASQRDPFDPMEKAFHDLGNAHLAQTEHLHADWVLEREYESIQEKCMSNRNEVRAS